MVLSGILTIKVSKQKRIHRSPEEKVRILRLHLLEGVPISQVCKDNGIAPTMFYNWQKQFFENGAAAFQSRSKVDAKQAKIDELQAKLAKKNEVLSEAVEALIEAKKLSGDR